MAEVEVPVESVEEAADKAFARRVALTTAVYAVVLALTALGGNNATKEMLLAQQQASNQWAYYQAKAQREHTYKIESMRLDAELIDRGPSMAPDARARYEDLRKRFAEEEHRYQTEKEDIRRQAEAHERERDLNKAKDPNFDFSETLLQVAIVVASVAILSGSRPLYGISMVFAVTGAFLCLNGYFLLAKLPGLH